MAGVILDSDTPQGGDSVYIYVCNCSAVDVLYLRLDVSLYVYTSACFWVIEIDCVSYIV